VTFPDHFSFGQLTMARIADDEIEETVELINPAYRYQESAKGTPRTNPEHLRRRVSETDFYVVKDAGQIVGCVYLEPREQALHFGLLTLADRYRKTGLAPAIMQALEAYARARHYDTLELDYMSLAPWLKRYYERYGFAETGEITNWGTIDLLHMSKRLER
jgi:GNAT superfamily N-acetyltransferase